MTEATGSAARKAAPNRNPRAQSVRAVDTTAGVRKDGIRRRKRSGAEGDDFYIAPHLIPKGYSVNWKTTSVLGKPVDDSILQSYYEQGWEPATLEQFPGIMSKNYTGKFIVRKGMMLMIRPEEYTKEALAEDQQAAAEQVRDKLKQLGHTETGELRRKVLNVKRGYERPPVDEE
jgi:hypothetical protein